MRRDKSSRDRRPYIKKKKNKKYKENRTERKKSAKERREWKKEKKKPKKNNKYIWLEKDLRMINRKNVKERMNNE